MCDNTSAVNIVNSHMGTSRSDTCNRMAKELVCKSFSDDDQGTNCNLHKSRQRPTQVTKLSSRNSSNLGIDELGKTYDYTTYNLMRKK